MGGPGWCVWEELLVGGAGRELHVDLAADAVALPHLICAPHQAGAVNEAH